MSDNRPPPTKQMKLMSFFATKSSTARIEERSASTDDSATTASNDVDLQQPTNCQKESAELSSNQPVNLLDPGTFTSETRLTSLEKLEVIRAVPFVASDYEFPSREFKEPKNRSGFTKRKCNPNFFLKYPYLGYSKIDDGVYCLPCKLFSNVTGTILVDVPFSKWKHLHDKISGHAATSSHRDAVTAMESFMKVAEGKQLPITEQVNKSAADLAAKNREVLTSLMRCMVLCVERGFATRGHRDAGLPIVDAVETEEDYVNLGNFKSIVRTMAVKDHLLSASLQGSSSYGTHVSWRAQVDMLKCILGCLQASILTEAKNQKGKFMFAVSVDEVTDVSVTEQLAIVLRTVGKDGIKERLLEYIDLESIRGKAVSDAVVECLTRHGLEIAAIRAQTYDGAANLSGVLNGAQAHIQQIEPLAEYFHCASHKLNLCLNATSKVKEFRLMVENIKQLGIFYHYSPKCTGNLKALLEQDATVTVMKLKLLCETRWVERHSTMSELKQVYSHVLRSLESMTGSEWDGKTIYDASGLHKYLSSTQFVASFVVAEHMLGYTKSLSKLLQGSTMNVYSAHKSIQKVIDTIASARYDSDLYAELYRTMERLTTLEKPRTVGRQTMRANPDLKEYIRVSFFLPYIDHLLSDLRRRFESSPILVSEFLLVPTNVCSYESRVEWEKDLQPFLTKYASDLPGPTTLKQELEMWYFSFCQDQNPPNELSAALDLASQSINFPNIYILLKILMTIPVTSASTERANSTLKYVKTNLRSTMSQMSLNAFVLGYKHKGLLTSIPLSTYVDKFIGLKQRRLYLQDLLSQ